MDIRIQFPLPASVVAAALIPFLGGCYTQLETVDSAYDEQVAVEDTVVAETIEEFDRDYPPPGYYATFSYYHPGFTVGYTSYDPWDWYYYPAPVWCSPWYPPYYYYPAYSCWPYYSSWYYPHHPVVYYSDNYPGGYYPGGGGRASETRDFGNTRGYGDGVGTRGRGGIAPRTGDKDGNPVSAVPVSISRSTRQGGATVASGSGKKTETAPRGTAVNRTTTRRSVQPQAAPADRGNTGATRGGSDRGSVSSSPKSSPPPPANSGSRGSSSNGGSRGRGPRSR